MMNKELEFAKQLARDAGEIMLRYFNQSDISHYKADNTIVTLADTEINQMVIDRVEESYPDYGVYGEEDSFGRDNEKLWVCDPIDGTAMFARGVPVAVFSLALVVDGEPIVGVVYDPFTDSLYEATKGGGARCNNEPIIVNEFTLGDKEFSIGYDYSPTMPINTLTVAYPLAERCRVGGVGSFVRNAVLVATGGFGCSIMSGSRPYDIAAAKVIVEEAGGKVTDIYGNEQRYDRDINGAIVSNGIVHDEIIKTIKENLK